ncbi:MAG: aminotransferase class IV family protein [Pseudomonadota bacterium]|nr:aminotransferase class IV family protein [Pseudomonadota bacterium]
MEKLLETLKIVNGRPQFINFHNERLHFARKSLFNIETPIDLKTAIKPPQADLMYRCRIIYAQELLQIDYSPYQPRVFKRFKIVIADDLDYSFKYLDRSALERLVALKGQADDILIIKKGLVTDTSIANVAFWNGYTWLTPKTPLLAGTTRMRLLRQGQLTLADIHVDALKNGQTMALLNAVLDFYVIDTVEWLW